MYLRLRNDRRQTRTLYERSRGCSGNTGRCQICLDDPEADTKQDIVHHQGDNHLIGLEFCL